MRIITPSEIEQVAWQGRLEPLAESFKGPGPLPCVTLGQPAWWPAAQAMEAETGKKWSPPAGDRTYSLLRLACTLHPPAEARSHYTEATLSAYLRPAHGPGRVLAHDWHPRQRTVEEKGTVKVGLGPELKFAGLGESRAYWQFRAHSAQPLLGCQSVYAVLDAPGDAGGVRLSVELMARVKTRWGLVVGRLPDKARAHLSRVIGA